ncbi:MAG: hypothetical protein HY303_10580 [Candidatus Wallbacteria bacterium]|nr:hypothetical protein [Candidatus Wallbacteria bacterium]
MQPTAAMAIAGACVSGALLVLGSGPAGVLGPLGASVGIGVSAWLRRRDADGLEAAGELTGVEERRGESDRPSPLPPTGLDAWALAGPESIGSGAGAALALAAADSALAGAGVWLTRFFYFGLLGYLVTLAGSYSARRAPGQMVYNLSLSTALWAWLARLGFGLTQLPPDALAGPGQTFLQGALLGFLMAVPRLGAPMAEGTET